MERHNGKKLRYCYEKDGLCGFRYYTGKSWQSFSNVKNPQGDIILIKDESGVPLVKYHYDIWGNVSYEMVVLAGTTVSDLSREIATANPFRYRGYYYDEESKLYYLLTRYYDPYEGIFISPDSFDYFDSSTIGGVNLYAYCNYNPIMYADPTGHLAILACLFAAFIGFGVGFASSAATQALFNGGNVNWGVAAVDGLFSSISAALWLVPGLVPVSTGLINAGLTAINGVITTGMENNWQYSAEDWVSIAFSAATSGVVSGITRNQFFKHKGQEILKDIHKYVGTVSKRIVTGYYNDGVNIFSKSYKSAVNQMFGKLIDLNFSNGFYKDWLITILQAIFSTSFSRGLNGIKW